MKKLLPVLLILILVSQAQAQYKPVLFGMRVGANLGWIKPDVEEYSGEGIVPGFTWGFIGEFYIMENYAILTGFNVNFNGGKMEYPSIRDIKIGGSIVNDTVQLHRKYNLKYIEIPLCLKMQTALSDKIIAFGKIGLGTSFLLSAKGTDDFIYDGSEKSESKHNIDDDIALMRESLIVGGGIELKIKGSTTLIIDITYDNAFNNMFNGDNTHLPGTEPKAIHNFVELGAGILF
ncbi:MAG: PorT family protein [Bacteroidales bacterium]|nr:PorT family protein [Bacteroidales bacterium]